MKKSLFKRTRIFIIFIISLFLLDIVIFSNIFPKNKDRKEGIESMLQVLPTFAEDPDYFESFKRIALKNFTKSEGPVDVSQPENLIKIYYRFSPEDWEQLINELNEPYKEKALKVAQQYHMISNSTNER